MFRVNTRRTKSVPIIFDFNVRTAAQLNKIAEEHWRKQMEQEEATQSEGHSVNSSKSNIP